MGRRFFFTFLVHRLSHEDLVKKVRSELPSEDTLYDLTELFRIFGDSTRIRILYVLSASEMCVCDIAALLGMTQSAISHQLKALKNARLVKSRREGKTVFYSLADSHGEKVTGLHQIQNAGAQKQPCDQRADHLGHIHTL